jgi:hypothetical protein
MASAIDERFDEIAARCAGDVSELAYVDRAIFYVVAVRREATANGFCAVFEQVLHHEEDLRFLVQVLLQLGDESAAGLFGRASTLLRDAGYFGDPTREFHALGQEVLNQLDEIGKEVLDDRRLWLLDSALLRLLAPTAIGQHGRTGA